MSSKKRNNDIMKYKNVVNNNLETVVLYVYNKINKDKKCRIMYKTRRKFQGFKKKGAG